MLYLIERELSVTLAIDFGLKLLLLLTNVERFISLLASFKALGKFSSAELTECLAFLCGGYSVD